MYPLDLGATEAQQTTISSLRGLPSTFKLLFGFISDNRPLLGYRRKSYMFCGWLLASLSNWALFLFSDLTVNVSHDEGGEEIRSVPENAPRLVIFIFNFFHCF